jgi:hypothetical protein
MPKIIIVIVLRGVNKLFNTIKDERGFPLVLFHGIRVRDEGVVEGREMGKKSYKIALRNFKMAP